MITTRTLDRLLAVCFSLEISAEIIRRHHLAQKENGTRQGRGMHEKKNRLQTLLIF